MSDAHSPQEFVGYPRQKNPLEYGTIQRLQALGQFANEVGEKLVLSFFALVFVLASLEPLLSNFWILLFVVIVVAMFGLYRTISSGAAHLAVGMGLSRDTGIFAGLFLPIMIAVLFFLFRGTVVPYVTPMTLLVVAGMLSIDAANRELRRYGVHVSKWALRCSGNEVARALAERRKWEANPLPPLPVDLYSGNAPKAQSS